MKILYVCSEFFAGMMPFGANVVNDMEHSGCEIFAVFVSWPDSNYFTAVNNENRNYTFLNSPEDKIGRALFRVRPGTVLKAIDKILAENKIDIIHLLTEDASLAPHLNKMSKVAKVVYTVHDFKTHEEKYKSLIQYLSRGVLLKKRVKYLMDKCKYLMTCSIDQYNSIKEYYPDKDVFFHDFPSLITPLIANGQQIAPELNGCENYILFFGRIELYKGVDILYNEYLKNAGLNKYPLVIAGSGAVYFDRKINEEKNVIFINRYIKDEEVAFLYKKSLCVIYPYISATQSGVTSLAVFFNKPMVVSNIPFLMQSINGYDKAYSFNINQPEGLGGILTEISHLASKKNANTEARSTNIKEQLMAAYEIIVNK